MKKQKFYIVFALLLVIPFALLSAQERKNQAFYIHEDRVKPSMTQLYKKVSKEFTEACKEHKLQDVSWVSASTSTGRYLSISPMEKFGDLDTNYFAPMIEKMGEEAFRDIFKRFDSCYDTHGDYIVYLNNELTYMPEGATSIPEDQTYRKWHFLYVAPNNIQKLKSKMKEIKKLYEKKGSKEYYRIFHNGFGNMGDYYVAVVAAKDAEDYAKKSKENDALLGEEGKKLFGEMMEYVLKYEVETGRMHPELAYSPSK